MNRYTRYIVAVIFIMFAVVQWNDPDPWIWILVYLITAVHAFIVKKENYSRWVDRLLLLSIVVAITTYIPSIWDWIKNDMPSIVESMKAEKPHVEWVREALGLLLCGLSIWFFRKK